MCTGVVGRSTQLRPKALGVAEVVVSFLVDAMSFFEIVVEGPRMSSCAKKK